MSKLGLVLEGGAMRGLFTAGVLDVLLENGVTFDGAVGVSAGAVFGCNYKSRQAGRVLRYNTRYCKDPRYCSLRSLIKTGDLYGADFCYRQLPEELDLFDTQTYEQNPMAFYVVCTDIQTGKAVYHRCDKADRESYEWMRASASMPLASRPVELEGRQYLDGGIADPIPLQFFQSAGYDKNVVVLTQPRDFVKKPDEELPLLRLALRRWPRLVDTLKKRHKVYNAETAFIRQQEQRGEVFVIAPAAPLHIGSVEKDPDELRRVYALGRRAAKEQLSALQDFLKKAQ